MQRLSNTVVQNGAKVIVQSLSSAATNNIVSKTYISNAERLDFQDKNYFIQQLYTGCLAEGSYYVESNKEAVIIDPLRDIDQYLKIAKDRGATIKYVMLTHFHADFVSGHYNLSQKTGAPIVYGPNAQADFKIHVAKDDEEFSVGNVKIVLLHTPGHTMESSSYLLVDEDKPKYIFTGDTLFLGEVGRPDLAVKGESLTKEDLAGYLFDSLHNKILNLPDEVVVLPAHGAGSPCGKSIQAGTNDTLGNQRKSNYALQITDRAQFVKILSSDLPVPPAYFFYDAAMNKQQLKPLEDIIRSSNVPLTPSQIEEYQNKGIKVVDVRGRKEFLQGFIPNSVQIDLEMTFALWVGKLVSPQSELIIVAPEGKEEESIIRLARIGYDHVKGWAKGGIQSWRDSGREVHTGSSISAEEFSQIYEEKQKHITIVDVRAPGERVNGYIEQSILLPLDKVENEHEKVLSGLSKDQEIFIHCKAGGRGSAALSILRSKGYVNLINVEGGMDKIRKTGIELKSATCSMSGK